MSNSKMTVLIADDEKINIDILANMLEDDYRILTAANGREALEMAEDPAFSPDLILLDIRMPELDGYEVCKRLKENVLTRDLPVIFITAMKDIEEEAHGLEMGAIDYITKPFQPSIIKIRVKNHLALRSANLELQKMYRLALDANPLTGLPGNNSIAAEIMKTLEDKTPSCVIYTDLDNFKSFNDKYGFAHGDEVLQFAGQVLYRALNKHTESEFFLGHIGGDDFMLIVPVDKTHAIAESIAQFFDEGILEFYNSEDVNSGGLESVNRQGQTRFFPFMTISMVGISLPSPLYTRYLEVSDACAELKKKAKNTPGSCFVMNRRLS